MKAMSPQPNAFLLSLPKAELHLHLEGAIDPTTLLELKRRHGTPSTLLDVEKFYRYDDFNGFLMAFKSITGDLQTPEDYELITYRLMQQLKNENILHAEVYVSVGVCLWRKQDFAPYSRAWTGTPKRRARLRDISTLDFRHSTPIRSRLRARGL